MAIANARIDRFTHTLRIAVLHLKSLNDQILAKEEEEYKHMSEFMIEVKR